MSDAIGSTEERGIPAGLGVLAATCVSTLVVNANTSAVTILLPAIAEDVNAPVSTLQWAVTGYSLVGAAFIVTSGALGDVFGRRKIFIGGLVLFIASCVLIALSDTQTGVIVGRCIQGAAGSTILASGLSLLTVASSGSERLKAVSLWGAASAVGAAAGPLVGGLLVDSTGWEGLFWIDAAIAAACIPITLRSIEESLDPTRPRSIDWFGTVLIATILAPLILAVSKGADWGWTSPGVLVCLLVSAASVFLFVTVEQRSQAPLVDLALMRNRVLIGATLGILIGAGTINGLMFVVSLYFQDPAALAMSPLDAGLATLPATIGLVVSAPLVPKMAQKAGAATVVALGFGITAAGFGVLALTKSSWGYAAFVIPFLVAAVGMSMTNGPCSSVSTSAVPAEQVGAASGISNMARYVGASVFTAVAAAVYSGTTTSKLDAGKEVDDALASGFARVALVMAILSALGIPLAIAAKRMRTPRPETIDYAAAAASHSHTLPRLDPVPLVR
ncbi:MAG TPA: MFS transporter [Ilumatobacter sp.]|jgi:EmrB/QacA subfamily drug resistance transporter|nr:MFS transporter [Ilumatobacter sp.]